MLANFVGCRLAGRLTGAPIDMDLYPAAYRSFDRLWQPMWFLCPTWAQGARGACRHESRGVRKIVAPHYRVDVVAATVVEVMRPTRLGRHRVQGFWRTIAPLSVPKIRLLPCFIPS